LGVFWINLEAFEDDGGFCYNEAGRYYFLAWELRMKTEDLTKEEILEFLRKNKEFFKKEFDVDNIMLFGSYARGEQTGASDIDILIDTEKKDFDNRCRLKELLEERFQKKVDLLYHDSVRRFIMRNIKDELIYA